MGRGDCCCGCCRCSWSNLRTELELELELVHPPLARSTHLRIELELELALESELERDHLEPPGARPAFPGSASGIHWIPGLCGLRAQKWVSQMQRVKKRVRVLVGLDKDSFEAREVVCVFEGWNVTGWHTWRQFRVWPANFADA